MNKIGAVDGELYFYIHRDGRISKARFFRDMTFADIADEEGFPEIALMYRNIAIAEKGHEERYRAFIQNIETASVFAKEGEVVWQCRNCGFIYTGKEAPQVCPACLHPQAYFEVKKSNY